MFTLVLVLNDSPVAAFVKPRNGQTVSKHTLGNHCFGVGDETGGAAWIQTHW